ncbi:hypothetical protein [Cellulomonas sp. SG140]|uniref:hypothetical protein n=1 Tax=Cellulomonas sp. SG140 TaxID=2976536 RepID=UPI0021E90ED4|nr:hypothetical protein [Cellulomonas sp. SG140]
MSAGRPDQNRLIRILVAVDAVLVGALVIALVVTGVNRAARTGSAATTGSSVGGSTSPAPSASASSGPAHFRLPSGNIACTLTADSATCTIANATFTVPPVAGCTGTVGHTVVLDANGVATPCETGPAPRPAGEDVPALPYGSSSTLGGRTCTSATDGVTCTDARGVGFRLARESLTLLPQGTAPSATPAPSATTASNVTSGGPAAGPPGHKGKGKG